MSPVTHLGFLGQYFPYLNLSERQHFTRIELRMSRYAFAYRTCKRPELQERWGIRSDAGRKAQGGREREIIDDSIILRSRYFCVM